MNPDHRPEGIDVDRPNAARTYDWALGGTVNFAVDRYYGEAAVKAYPQLREAAQANRAFLGRAVRYCVANVITQFLDLGSGIPSMGNVHEIADEADDETRCVYVDIEPVAVAHARMLLDEAGDPARHAMLQADLCDADKVWQAVLDTGILDPDRPIGLLTVAVLHFLPDATGVHDSIEHYRDLLPPESMYVLSHLTDSGVDNTQQTQLRELADNSKKSSTPGVLRSYEQIMTFFGDFELIEPGLVPVGQWHPAPDDPGTTIKTAIGGIARKPR